MTAYIHRPWQVDAVGWTGTNLDEVKKFFAGIIPTAIVQVDLDNAHMRSVRGARLEIITDERRYLTRAESIIVVHRDPSIRPNIGILPPTVFKRSYRRG